MSQEILKLENLLPWTDTKDPLRGMNTSPDFANQSLARAIKLILEQDDPSSSSYCAVGELLRIQNEPPYRIQLFEKDKIKVARPKSSRFNAGELVDENTLHIVNGLNQLGNYVIFQQTETVDPQRNVRMQSHARIARLTPEDWHAVFYKS